MLTGSFDHTQAAEDENIEILLRLKSVDLASEVLKHFVVRANATGNLLFRWKALLARPRDIGPP